MNKYGINNVVGGFGRSLTPEEAIPYAIHRTYLEHKQLRLILEPFTKDRKFKVAMELGCGYGRNLPILHEFSDHVCGVERDLELFQIARTLNKESVMFNQSVDEYWCGYPVHDLVLTFTFLQHLNEEEMKKACKHINASTMSGAIVVLCEETDMEKSHQGCWSRTPEQYAAALGNFSILNVRDRWLEPTFIGRVSGKFIVLRKDSI